MALGFIINALSIFLPLGVEFSKSETPKQSTNVQIIPGLLTDTDPGRLGGNVPHIALWDDEGVRIGQYHPDAHSYIDGKGDPTSIAVVHNQNGGQKADPYYIMLSNLGNDAICLSAVTVGNGKVSATLYGDTGQRCGQSWFPSKNPIGNGFYKPKCVWLDGDHSNGINARAISFHVNDMAPNEDKIKEYQNNPDTLCHSTPRFSFWGNLLPDGIIPFFEPRLKYNIQRDLNQGSDKDPQRVIDKPGQYDKSVYLSQNEKKSKRATGRPRRKDRSRGANHNPEHLIITNHPLDDVREVCEHPNSYGFDIASTVQHLYCDMEHKQLYYICNDQEFQDNCFDLDTKAIVPRGGINARNELSAATPWKNYTSVDNWGE
jgi:hypothetical protein